MSSFCSLWALQSAMVRNERSSYSSLSVSWRYRVPVHLVAAPRRCLRPLPHGRGDFSLGTPIVSYAAGIIRRPLPPLSRNPCAIESRERGMACCPVRAEKRPGMPLQFPADLLSMCNSFRMTRAGLAPHRTLLYSAGMSTCVARRAMSSPCHSLAEASDRETGYGQVLVRMRCRTSDLRRHY